MSKFTGNIMGLDNMWNNLTALWQLFVSPARITFLSYQFFVPQYDHTFSLAPIPCLGPLEIYLQRSLRQAINGQSLCPKMYGSRDYDFRKA